MAQGCNVFLDPKDFGNIKANLIKTNLAKKEKVDNRTNSRKVLLHNMNNPSAFREILLDKKNINHDKTVTLLHVALVGERTPKSETRKLAPALAQVLKHHQTLPGMFEKVPKYRSKNASPMNQHYEMTATAKLTQMGEANRELKTTSGVNLAINKTASVKFGPKFNSVPFQNNAKSGTYEPDILIQENYGDHPIGIDTKFTKNSVCNLRISNLGPKLEQISSGILGYELESFNFVTNAEFGNGTKKTINKANIALVETYLGYEYNSDFKGSYNKVCEMNNVDPNNVDLNKNQDVLLQIMQSVDGKGFIGVAENVVFEL